MRVSLLIAFPIVTTYSCTSDASLRSILGCFIFFYVESCLMSFSATDVTFAVIYFVSMRRISYSLIFQIAGRFVNSLKDASDVRLLEALYFSVAATKKQNHLIFKLG